MGTNARFEMSNSKKCRVEESKVSMDCRHDDNREQFTDQAASPQKRWECSCRTTNKNLRKLIVVPESTRPLATIVRMDHHTVAMISIAGTSLDVLGSLYLAYDLLGGQHGPLRLLTRAVTYSLAFGIGYGLGLGIFFGFVAGIATGITLAIEFNRAARGLDHYSLTGEGLCSAIRGLAFGAGLYRTVGLQFALAFAVLITAGQIFAYSRGMRPAMDYSAQRRPRFTRRQLQATIIRTVGYIATALICSALIHHVDHPWSFAIRVGLVTGIVTGVGGTISPYVEYYADHLPERRLGVFGVGLLLCGFALQSVQYWLALLDVRLT